MKLFNSILKTFIILLLSILIIIIGILKIKLNTTYMYIIIIIILIFIVILIDILGIVILNKIKNNIDLQDKLNNITIIIYNIIEKNKYGIYEEEDIENQLQMVELNKIKEDIKFIYNKYYKYYFYINLIDDIKIKLIKIKRKSLMKYIINEINIHKSISSKIELQNFIKLKMIGLNTDLNIYKNYLKDFFISLNTNNDINKSLLL